MLDNIYYRLVNFVSEAVADGRVKKVKVMFLSQNLYEKLQHMGAIEERSSSGGLISELFGLENSEDVLITPAGEIPISVRDLETQARIVTLAGGSSLGRKALYSVDESLVVGNKRTSAA